VRDQAMGFLAVRNDPVAVRILEDSLKSPQAGSIPKPDAIAYLAANDPREHFAAIRPQLQDARPETRVAAVMALGADPVSRPAIVRMVGKSESPKVREAALQSLSANDKDFPTYAVKLAQDRQEDPHIRSIAVLELNKVLNRNQAPAEDAQRITTTLRTLLLDAANQPLEVRAASLEALSVHDPQFPGYIQQITASPADPLRQRALQAIEKNHP
jgi:HEAT repeat protein